MKGTGKKMKKIIVGLMLLVMGAAYIHPAVQAAGSTIDAATAYTLGTTETGAITDTQDSNYYVFTIPESGKINIKTTVYAKWSYIKLFDASKKEIWYRRLYRDDTSGVAVDEVTEHLTAGTYYFLVQKDYSYTGNYSFSISYESAGESFPESQSKNDNSFDKANTVGAAGQSYTGQLASNDNKDDYAFVLDSSGMLKLNTVTYMRRVNLKLYDADGVEIWSESQWWNDTSQMGSETYSLALAKGAYYLVFDKADGYKGKYSFSMNLNGAAETFPEGKGGCNNSIASASPVQLNQTISGFLAMNDNCDYYMLSVPAKRNLHIQYQANMDGADIKIFSTSGSELWSDRAYADNTTGAISYSNNSVSVDPGTYYIYVGPASWRDSKGSYTLTVGTYTPVASISFNVTKKTITAGKSFKIKATVNPADATEPGITWSSANSDIAKVTNGKVKGIQAGVTTIYATSNADGEVKASCQVIVRPKKVVFKSLKRYTSSYKKKKGFKASWAYCKGASGYQVVYARNSKFTKKVKKYATGFNTVYITGLKEGTYYVKIHAYTLADGKKVYGSYSKVKKITIK